jgi:hypothetical protein
VNNAAGQYTWRVEDVLHGDRVADVAGQFAAGVVVGEVDGAA